jgi:hypothetical protein
MQLNQPCSKQNKVRINLFMSNLTGLLNEAERTQQRLKDAITSGNYDLMTKIEKSSSELNSRIFFARRDELADKLKDLAIEKTCALELQTELLAELKLAAADVMKAKSNLYDAESAFALVKSKQYFTDNQIELNRTESNRIGALLNQHIQSRLSGTSGELPIDLMENSIC